jgi:hypothetical protein
MRCANILEYLRCGRTVLKTCRGVAAFGSLFCDTCKASIERDCWLAVGRLFQIAPHTTDVRGKRVSSLERPTKI